MVTNNLIATNTLFEHLERHLTTWQEKLKDEKIHNTVDSILSYNKIKKLIIDSISYSGITTSTDHRLVKMKLTTPKTHHHHFIIVRIFTFFKGSLTSYHDLTLALHFTLS